MYQIIENLCIERGLTIGRLCKETGISSSTFTELKSGRTKELSAKNVSKVADFFGVTIDYLLGKSVNKENPTAEGDEALMFALWGGDTADVTPEMISKVKEFARFVQEEERRKKNDTN